MIEPGFTVMPPSPVCLDCRAPISGHYCANCGQETRIETPTVRQFAYEMLDQYVAVEGKLGRTLRVLVTQPGQLTLDYVEGRRQRFVRPLKLYVSVSVVFFTLLGVLPDSINPFMKFDSKDQKEGAKVVQQVNDDAAAEAAKDQHDEKSDKSDKSDDDDDSDAGKSAPAAKPAAPPPPDADTPKPEAAKPANQAASAAAQASPPAAGDLRQQIKQQIDAELSHAKPGDIDADVHKQVDSALSGHGFAASIKDRAMAFSKLTPEEQSKALRAKLADDAPYAMFGLLPYFALLLRLLYRKNRLRYGVHLLFSVHLHCFIFIVLALGFLPLPSFVHTAMELAIAVYVYFALHKVYGGTWGRTLWRMALLYFFYIAAVGATTVSGVISAVLGGVGT